MRRDMGPFYGYADEQIPYGDGEPRCYLPVGAHAIIGLNKESRRMHHTLITRRILVAAAFMVVAAINVAAATGAPLPNPQFRSYGLREGLPSSKVQAVVQDSQGFIWVATSVGLARFDGVEFITPRTGASDGPPIPAIPVSLLVIDRRDRLWMSSRETGLARYDPGARVFSQWPHAAGDEPIRALAPSRDGAVWIGTASGLGRTRADGEPVEFVAWPPADRPAGPVNAIHEAEDGRLWVGTEGGLAVRDPSGGWKMVPLVEAGMPRVLSLDSHGLDVRVSTDVGLFLFSHASGSGQQVRLTRTATYASLADSHGTLWLAGLQGLVLRDARGRMHDVAGSWNAKGGLPGRTVRNMLEDREHGLWFALTDGGLAYLGPSWSDFTVFSHVATDPFTFPGRAVTAVADRGGGQLWVGGFRGWIRAFDPSRGVTSEGFDIGSARVQSLLGLPGERVLIGTVDGLSLGSKGIAVPVLREVIDRPVTAMVRAIDGTIFVASQGRGLFRLGGSLHAATALRHAESLRGVNDTRQIDVVDGDLWQASVAGLARRDRASGDMRFVEGVARGRVSAFEPDRKGFWLVRPDALEHYRWENGAALMDRRLGGKEGFPSADILTMRRDVAGRLWLYGQTGVWRFDPMPGTFRPFGLADGIAHGEFTNATTVQLDDGSMYGGTLGGLVGFRPDAQRDHARQPPIAMLGASVWRDGRRQGLPMIDDTLHLAWTDRDLRVRARVLSFVNPDRNHLDFSLSRDEGSRMQHTGKEGEPDFDNLGAGTWRLVITGSGRDGLDGTSGPPLTVIVDAPPWLRWWAWLGYLALAACIVAAFTQAARRRVRQAMRIELAEQQQRMAEEANAAKTDFMATLGHEIRTPMTGVLGMAELMSRTSLDTTQRAYVDAVQRSGATLLRLVNDALDITRIESRRLMLESECVSPHAIASEVLALAAGAADAKGLALTVVVEPLMPSAIRGDTVRLRQILQNLVNNAVKFTAAGSVSVCISRTGSDWSMTVRDTGPGMSDDLCERVFARFEQGGSPQRSQGAGLGLAICHELCALMQGGVTVQSRLGQGSVFTVRLPLIACACHGKSRILPSGSPGAGAHRRVLLVEDDPVVSDVISRLLRERGHVVATVGDGLSALTALARMSYDALLLDLDLPVVDGFQVARMLRRNPALAGLPVIAVTARSTGDEMAAIRAAGMDTLLRKPMTGDDLEAALDEACAASPGVASRIA